jgi:hypothetical protein
MDSSIPQQPPPEHIVGDPGAGWRRFARFGAIVYAITTIGNLDEVNLLASRLSLPGDPVMETILRRLLVFSALAVGPAYFILSSPRSLRSGVQRTVGTFALSVLWFTGLWPLFYAFFDTDSGNVFNSWACGYAAAYLFILLILLLHIRQMHPVSRLLAMGLVPIAVACAVLMVGCGLVHGNLRGSCRDLLLPAVASAAILISWLFWYVYIQRHFYGDNLWWLRAWRRLDAFDPFHNKWIAAVSGDVGRKVARVSAVACLLTFVLYRSEFGRMSLPHSIEWPPGLASTVAWALFLMLLGIGPVYSILCSPRRPPPGPLSVLGWGLLLVLTVTGISLLCFYMFDNSPSRGVGRVIGVFVLNVMIVILMSARRRPVPTTVQRFCLWAGPLVLAFCLLVIIALDSSLLFYPGPLLRAIVVYSFCLFAIGMGGFLWFLPSMHIKRRGQGGANANSISSGTGVEPRPSPDTGCQR